MIFFLNNLFQYEIIYIDLSMKKTFETQKTILKTCIKFEIPNTTLRFRLFRFFNVNKEFRFKLFNKWSGHGILILPPIMHININMYMYELYMYI